IQVGRISHFGLMEMSRQRIRFGVVESSTHKCPTCQGTGLIRSVESLALMVMRNVEDHVLRKPGQSVNVRVPTDVALYILNTKRASLNGLEAKYDLSINIVADDHVGPIHFAIERGEARVRDHREQAAATHVRVDTAAMDEADIDEVEDEEVEATEERAAPARQEDGGERTGRRRRRRHRGEDRDHRPQQRQPVSTEAVVEAEDSAESEDMPRVARDDEPRDDSDEPRKRRRRGRRGGRRNRRPGDEATDRIEAVGDASAAAASEESAENLEAAGLAQDMMAELSPTPSATEPAAEAPAGKPKRARRTRKSPDAESTVQDAAPEAAPAEPEIEVAPKPKGRTRKPKVVAEEAPAPAAVESAAPAPVEAKKTSRKKALPADEIVISSTTAEKPEDQPKKKGGWWQRGFLGG
ncbi:MAG: ribonuclease E/G, partial [Devosia sp.]|nr:ribonuclease E/G [Devosia sp.]